MAVSPAWRTVNAGDAASYTGDIGALNGFAGPVSLAANFNATFIQANNSAGNYVRFTITAGGFTLTATPGPSSAGSKRAPVNAIQIVPR